MNRRIRRAASKIQGMNTPVNEQALFLQSFKAHQEGRLSDAEAGYRMILRTNPRHAHVLSLLGTLASTMGQHEDALRLIDKAISINGAQAIYWSAKADTLKALMRYPDAIFAYRRSIMLKPDFVEAMNNLGRAYFEDGQYENAERWYRSVIIMRPDFTTTLNNLGNLVQSFGRIGESIRLYHHALAVEEVPVAHHNLGVAYADGGRMALSSHHFAQSVAMSPDHAAGAAALVFGRLYQSGSGLKDVYEAAVDWGRRYAVPAPQPIRRPDQPCSITPRLGFISGDFRLHAVGLLVLPCLQGLIARGHSITLYHNSDHQDHLTAKFKEMAGAWRDVAGLSDDDLLTQIKADGIDILVDLSGHTRYNRVGALMRRAAPVQVWGWLGYPATSGIPAMHYFIGDRWQIPDGAQAWYTEAVVRMPNNYVTFAPEYNSLLADVPMRPTERPDGPFTFGSFNVLKKTTPECVAAWAEVLRRAPGSRFIMKANGLGCPDTLAYYRSLFGDVAERVTFMGRTPHADHMAAMAQTDLALDTFPYSGGQTTLELLWMGVPVVTMPGETMASRHSFGYLSGIGLERLCVTQDVASYVETAVNLANHQHFWVQETGIRQRILQSNLADADRFAADLERAFLYMWRLYCAGSPPASIDL